MTHCRPRRRPKLHLDGDLFELGVYLLRKYWSTEQIGSTLKGMFTDDTDRQVSHEAIYNALYVMPRGSLKKELIACVRQGNGKRRHRSRGKDRRQQIPDLERRWTSMPWCSRIQTPVRAPFNSVALGT